MSFHEQPFSVRFGAMGDEAEREFLKRFPNAVRYGLERPDINLAKVPAFIRYTPDFLQHNRLVEVMGVGRDGVLKLKDEKLKALMQWDRTFDTYLFVWDSHKKRSNILTIRTLNELRADFTVAQFHEGKLYYEISVDDPWWGAWYA